MKTYCIGFDPGFARAPTGAALLSFDGSTPALIGTLSFYAGHGGDWQTRCDSVLAQIDDWLTIEIFPYYPPLLFAYELAHVHTNPQTALRLADLGGGIRGLARAHGCEAIGVEPTQSKIALAKEPSATKEQMQDAAQSIFGKKLSEHEADAVGHALSGQAIWHRAKIVKEALS